MPASRVLIFGSDPISLLQQQIVFFGWFSKFFGPAARPWLSTASRPEVSIVRFVPSLLFERTSRTSREILRNGHATVSCSDLTLLGGGRRTSALSGRIFGLCMYTSFARANQLRVHDTSHLHATARAGVAEAPARSRFDASGWSDQPDAMLELEPLVGNRAWMLGLCLIANWRLGNQPIRQGNHTVF
jgi:hypothetical protein